MHDLKMFQNLDEFLSSACNHSYQAVECPAIKYRCYIYIKYLYIITNQLRYIY